MTATLAAVDGSRDQLRHRLTVSGSAGQRARQPHARLEQLKCSGMFVFGREAGHTAAVPRRVQAESMGARACVYRERLALAVLLGAPTTTATTATTASPRLGRLLLPRRLLVLAMATTSRAPHAPTTLVSLIGSFDALCSLDQLEAHLDMDWAFQMIADGANLRQRHVCVSLIP